MMIQHRWDELAQIFAIGDCIILRTYQLAVCRPSASRRRSREDAVFVKRKSNAPCARECTAES